jgi:four helix bundle protein
VQDETLVERTRVNYKEWEQGVADDIRQDSLWQMTTYRLALFASDLGWRDTAKLMSDRRMRGLSDQLYCALGSISANVAEGYSRGTGKDRARFYEYALGSARESRDWYFKARYVLGDPVYLHRLALLTRIIQLLLKTIPEQRDSFLHEQAKAYETDPMSEPELAGLLRDVPLPEAPDV